ncbi:DoxX family protein [Neobacillus niacini]|uniref:DoxX family protein n=1 Tax=Neobacillus niacini TaxID=86668 RepID=UPI00285C12D0|nr:DoxX family protein [Neobacillus niacini]MDR6998954.1 thiosulfate dehydrogenase [quinone] large subunit [Neobacillus niacini]
MFNQFLRENKVAAAVLTVIRLYLGYEWMMAGLHKLTGGFDATGFLKGAIANPVKGPDGSIVYATYVGFLKHFALPNADLFNTMVPLGEFLVGLGLILGCLTTAAVFFALVMNFAYVMAGTVSSNPMDILLGVIIIAAGYNAGRFGLDRWVLPFIRRTTVKGNKAVNHTV